MSRLNLVHSFLDRFEVRLELDCQRLKRELLAQVDQQFDVLRTKVREVRSRFGGGDRTSTARCVPLFDDPPVKTVQLDQWRQEQHAMVEASANTRNAPSTSTVNRKRKSLSRSGNNKRLKTGTTTRRANKFLCKSCGQSFPRDYNLAEHERIHLNIKPFSCTWTGCRYSAVQKSRLTRHVRMKHFKLPQLQKEQARRNIVDNRDPEDYIQVDNQLLERRLE